MDVNQRGAGIVAVEESLCSEARYPAGNSSNLTLVPPASARSRTSDRQPLVALKVVGISAALGQLA